MIRIGLLGLLVACGGSRERTIDAGPPDAAIDTLGPPTADAAAGAVTVSVTVGGIPAANVPVYFQDADSTLVLAVTTDAQGTAGAIIAAGGYVTLIEPPAGDGRVHLSTFAAVEPGDALHLDLEPRIALPPVVVDLTVDTAAETSRYDVFTSCGAGVIAPEIPVGPTVTGTIQLEGCTGGAADIIVMPFDADNNALGAKYYPNRSVDGGPVALDDGAGYPALVNKDFTYSAVPPEISFVGTYHALTTERGLLFDGSTGNPQAASVTNTMNQPVAPGTTALTATAFVPAANQFGEQLVMDWEPSGGSYALDVSATLIAPYASGGTYDPATHSIAWTEAGGVQPDVVRAQLGAYRDDIPEGRAWSWRIVAPHGGTKVSYPRLPNDGFDFNPAEGDTVSISQLTTARLPAGYARAVRERGFDTLKRLITGPSGRLVVQELYVPEPIESARARPMAPRR